MHEVRDWFGGLSRVLFVHAHPDDETIATGGTLAALAAASREPLLITCTRGEMGEVRSGPFAHLAGTDALAPHRMQELAAAIGLLGVERHAFLGVPPARAEGLTPTIYEDSGMAWGEDGRATAGETASADALTRVAAFEPLADLLTGANEAGATAIVSYDDGGGYGHPDHVFAHRIARAVAEALELPFWAIIDPESDAVHTEGDPAGATPFASDIEAYDVTPWLPRKIAALRAYQTQLEVDGDDIVHVGGQRQPISRTEAFVQM